MPQLRVRTSRIERRAQRRLLALARLFELDSYEGVAPSDSTVATQLGQITGEIAAHKDQSGYAGTAAKLRVAASVFGTA